MLLIVFTVRMHRTIHSKEFNAQGFHAVWLVCCTIVFGVRCLTWCWTREFQFIKSIKSIWLLPFTMFAIHELRVPVIEFDALGKYTNNFYPENRERFAVDHNDHNWNATLMRLRLKIGFKRENCPTLPFCAHT